LCRVPTSRCVCNDHYEEEDRDDRDHKEEDNYVIATNTKTTMRADKEDNNATATNMKVTTCDNEEDCQR
jgi:hypothetical protein